MKIYLDNIIFSLQTAGGISVYWHEMIKRLLTTSQNVSFIEQETAKLNIFRKQLHIPSELVHPDRSWPRPLVRYLAPSAILSPLTIFHSSYYRTHADPRVINIITAYDFIYERYRSGLPRLVHHTQKERAVRHADGIICISDSTKRDLLHHFPHTPESKIKTIHLSAAAEYKRINVPGDIAPEFSELLDRKVILYVGDRSGYKNFVIALETVHHCKDATLVAVGGRSFANDELTHINKLLNGRFQHYATLDNTKLNQLYNLAFCLLYPSSYEGFGIPALEAMQAGCPVVAANCSSLPEVCGSAGIMVAEISVECFVENIGRLTNPLFREDIVHRGLQQAERFSWDHTFDETMEFYRHIHANKCSLVP
ncbi:MAG: glycosyltransferase [Geobacter sp.]|nr:MAG: glycosyltransferase [Geobacter sp.]